MQFGIKLHETKLKLLEELRNKNSETTITQTAQAKLPKLVITKVNGSYTDWPRFWGEYTEDKSSVPPVTKFSYLRELLDHRVRKTIKDLPYTAKGHNQAVSILKDRFGKESEVFNAYVKEPLELPYAPVTNAGKIHEFHEKLSCCVQSLESLKQLHRFNGLASMTLEKLPVVRGDLVRNDLEWETCGLAKLTEELKLWTRRKAIEGVKKADQPSKNQAEFSKHS